MDNLISEIALAAARAVQLLADSGREVDYSEASLDLVEEALAEAAEFRSELSAEVLDGLVRDFGAYVLEVGRRSHGGRYAWLERSQEPVLVTGEPDRHIALAAWEKVRGRLGGDAADHIPFHYAGFCERVASASIGTRVLVA